jgi:hypothetical protein
LPYQYKDNESEWDIQMNSTAFNAIIPGIGCANPGSIVK